MGLTMNKMGVRLNEVRLRLNEVRLRLNKVGLRMNKMGVKLKKRGLRLNDMVLRLKAKTLKAGPLNKGQTNQQTDGRTDKISPVFYMTLFFWAAALLTIRKSGKTRKAGQRHC